VPGDGSLPGGVVSSGDLSGDLRGMEMCLSVRWTSFFGMETVEFNGASFWVESLGSEKDPALILIHSGIASARMWDRSSSLFLDCSSRDRYDCREFGRTTTENVVFSDVDPYSSP
jgi:hypothetical protein